MSMYDVKMSVFDVRMSIYDVRFTMYDLKTLDASLLVSSTSDKVKKARERPRPFPCTTT